MNIRRSFGGCQHMFSFAPRRRSHPFRSFHAIVTYFVFQQRERFETKLSVATKNTYRCFFIGGRIFVDFHFAFGSAHLSDAMCKWLTIRDTLQRIQSDLCFQHSSVYRNKFHFAVVVWVTQFRLFLKVNVPAEMRQFDCRFSQI